jgi:hypothetical protein
MFKIENTIIKNTNYICTSWGQYDNFLIHRLIDEKHVLITAQCP